ncbi:chemotaxis protein CheA [Aestuariibacter sp. AA17]|uniref:Chemotaxis protein CheA n=1 Tax=Fluctibacter corallii TaxID=2984329 RepID=A0ABT3ACP6_9ALTE|nr:chemotaxis protein CheA [Aestuariibacter sp. AA17]MCV2886439.1 chemotaxis protein CheA [Aestuariibacter sp. AA17]
MDLLNVFLEEAREHLNALEESLLVLEQSPSDASEINTAFRAMHTIKGSAGMVGLDHVSYFTHHVETLFDQVRKGIIRLDHASISLLLDAKDHVESLIFKESSNEMMAISEQLIHRLQDIAPTEHAVTPEAEIPPSQLDEGEGYWRITIAPDENAFVDGFDCMPVLRELQSLGDSALTVGWREQPQQESFDPLKCNLVFLLLLSADVSKDSIHDAFMFVQDDWQIDIDRLSFNESDKLGDILQDIGAIDKAKIEAIQNSKPKLGELLSESGLVSEKTVDQALQQQAFIRKEKEKTTPSQPTIKVPSNKLDRLMDLVSELVIVHSAISQVSLVNDIEALDTASEELGRLTAELRDTTFSVRMLPIGSTFGRFRRLVRDLSRELGKQVQLETYGADTELDKVVLERLGDPLVHILRNSLDHGIEMADVRQAAGKSSQGTIKLEATYESGSVKITVSDDGGGLHADKILAKAIERGVVSAEDNLSVHEIQNLIFEPGFSTAAKVSDVSGRGVGMDVVKTSIEALQGQVTIDSVQGKGTAIAITLPMTLAIIEGLLVRIGIEYYVIPLNTVQECIEEQTTESMLHQSTRVINCRGDYITCINLRQLFHVKQDMPKLQQTIICRAQEQQFGLSVDEIVGQRQTVIKNLSPLYRHTTGLLGATILGDGNVALILDINDLYDSCQLSDSYENMPAETPPC